MKRIVYLIALSLMFSYCKAQSPVIPRFNNGGTFRDIEGAYYKDVDHYFDQFVGTWLYTDGTQTLKSVFVKKEMMYDGDYYEDCLVGEYQYIVSNNGELESLGSINTLYNLTLNHTSLFDYNMYSITQMRKTSYPICTECADDEKRLLMNFDQPNNDDGCLQGVWIMRVVVENGVQKLKVKLMKEMGACGYTLNGTPSSISNFTVPMGEYTLTKQ